MPKLISLKRNSPAQSIVQRRPYRYNSVQHAFNRIRKKLENVGTYCFCGRKLEKESLEKSRHFSLETPIPFPVLISIYFYLLYFLFIKNNKTLYILPKISNDHT